MEWAITIAAPGRTFPKAPGCEQYKNFAIYLLSGVPCFLLQIILSEHCGQPPHHVYVRYDANKTAKYLLKQVDSLFPFGAPVKFRLMIGRENVDLGTTMESICQQLEENDTILVCRPTEQ